MRLKKKAAIKIMPKTAATPTKPAFFVKSLPSEVKIVGALLLMLAALYVFQLISSPSFLKSQANAVTGLVVSDSSDSGQQQPAAATTTATAKETEPQAQQPKPATTPGVPIKIISPPKGSTQAPGFSVNIEVSSQVLQCYYALKDNGQFTWDRRMKPCWATLPVSADHCKTPGTNTCHIDVEAWSSDGNLLGTDSASYGIK